MLVCRLGLVDPSQLRMKQLGVAFTTYHTLKHAHSELIVQSVASRNFDAVLGKAREIALAAAISFSLRMYFSRTSLDVCIYIYI